MVGNKKKKKGRELFEDYYLGVFGDRWDSLKKALQGEKRHTEFRFSEELPSYFLDSASVTAAESLAVEEGDNVLDLCAAPGGKSLILAQFLGKKGRMISNDRSANRRNRLLKVLDEHLPIEVRQKIQVTGHDASTWCKHETEVYDKILLDAPCSSERHVLESDHHLGEWAVGRTKRLATTQWSILSSAFLVLKTGGRMVYSTCALSPLENDEVVKKLIKKYGDQVELKQNSINGGELTEYGKIFLPDRGGHGPLYISVIEKLGKT